MDLLDETRQTQVQIPLPVVEHFFHIEKDKPADISISVLQARSNSAHPPTRRHFWTRLRALMRRLEMPQIKTMKRPLAVVFVKLQGKAKYGLLIVGADFCTYSNAINA